MWIVYKKNTIDVVNTDQQGFQISFVVDRRVMGHLWQKVDVKGAKKMGLYLEIALIF